MKLIKILSKLFNKKPHEHDFKVVQTFGSIYYMDSYYRCKCGKGAIQQHGFRFTILDDNKDHPYGKSLKKPHIV
jgi:hypothetical protein